MQLEQPLDSFRNRVIYKLYSLDVRVVGLTFKIPGHIFQGVWSFETWDTLTEIVNNCFHLSETHLENMTSYALACPRAE